jgi:large subunit ribosomal protein L6
MSRIGNKPVAVIDGVNVSIDGRTVSAEGPQGKMQLEHRPEVSVAIDEAGKQIVVSRQNDERLARSFHGLTRSLIENMVIGVKNGYEKRLEIVGVGYIGSVEGDTLSLRVGFANEIKKKIPTSLDVACPDQTHIVVKGCDKQKVGQFAAEVRAVRKPEPYKGKGIRYQGEHIKLKPGKAAT